MAGMLTVPRKETISVLDPGAGSGILSAAVIEMIEKDHPDTNEVHLTCYETNSDIMPLLEANIEYMTRTAKVKLRTTIINENYILEQSDDFSGTLMASQEQKKYDMIIANPPYFKLPKDAPEALGMPEVCHGAPNIYFLFAAMSLFNLCDEGEMVYIVPRSWTSGSYFSRFRRYLLHHGKLTDIHIFGSRKKVFDNESVLQETMIMKLRKTFKAPSMVKISSSIDSKDFSQITEMLVPYDVVVSGPQSYVYLATSHEEVSVLEKVNGLGMPMPEMGLRMKTGLTVDYRNKELLRSSYGDNTVPLFYSQHVKDGRVVFPIGKDNEYMSDELPGMVQQNRNYLFVKRFTAKEERRRLQCAVYLASQYPDFDRISTQNKINFIDTVDNSDMSDALVYGLYTLLNSTLYDMYYRILNGSTQVNACEMNSIPLPARDVIEHLGRELLSHEDFSTENCDRILEEVIYARRCSVQSRQGLDIFY